MKEEQEAAMRKEGWELKEQGSASTKAQSW
jgi:hypothetical protein